MDLEPMATDPMVPTPTTEAMATTQLARGLLMLMPLLMLMLTTDTTAMLVPMPMATDPMVPTPTTGLMDTTLLARGLLMLSPLLMLMLTTDTTAMPVPMPMDTDPTVPTPTELDTTDTGKPAIPNPNIFRIPKNQNRQPQPAKMI